MEHNTVPDNTLVPEHNMALVQGSIRGLEHSSSGLGDSMDPDSK